MRVEVHCFAVLRQRLGSAVCHLELPDGATVADLKAGLQQSFPSIASLVPAVLVAVNDGYASDETLIPEGAEVALIPPVSGG